MANLAKSDILKKNLIVALEKSLGIVTMACEACGTSRDTFYRYCKEDKEFKQQVVGIEGMAIDFVESQLFARIKEGKEASTIFYLKTKGKNRGYVERQELTGLDGTPITFNFIKASTVKPKPS